MEGLARQVTGERKPTPTKTRRFPSGEDKHAVSRAWEILQHPRSRNIFSPHEHPLTVLLQISLRNRADLFGKKNSQNRRLLWESSSLLRPEDDVSQASIPAWTPNHPTQDDRYWAIPPAGGSAGPLAAYVGTISSGPSLTTLLARVALSPSKGQSRGQSPL
ncbi:hypothetical protein E2C01_081768 [Portunus trituberculatus]|uniref:Uncharacterized protein n=1 Tax=Portunus trituberculatus TaxID=210409 RepID=A0A5B7IZR5_PORTR|nr:hypothetical protein [Portunus trituberculatus]